MVRLLRMLGPVLIALAIVLVLLWAGQRSVMYLPTGTVRSPADAGVPAAEAFSVRTADGLSLGAWFLTSEGNTASATVLVFNGNAGNRSYRAALGRRLAEAGFHVCLFDYRGYGDNPGSPSERGLLLDARAVHDAVAGRKDVNPQRIILMGESLGTGVAVALAAEAGPFALVLRSPFTSMADVGAHHYWYLPVRRLIWDRFDSLSRIGTLTCPIAVVAGEGDRVVPFALSQRLFDGARAPKRFIAVSGADHNDFDLNAGDQVVEAVRWAAAVAQSDRASRPLMPDSQYPVR